MGLKKDNMNQPYIIGRATALVEDIIGADKQPIPEHIICPNTERLMYWIKRAIDTECIDDKRNELVGIVNKIALPLQPLGEEEEKQYYKGYYHQKSSIERKLINKELGDKIRTLREQAQLSQKELGEKTGLTQANIANIENGKYSMQIDTANKLVTALGYKIEFVQNT